MQTVPRLALQAPPPTDVPRPRLAKRPSRTRGAAFVEAVIVISFFILALSGIVYFKTLYRTKIRASRIARASTIQYAMIGCPEGAGVAAGTAEDRKGLAPSGDSENAQVKNNSDTGGLNDPKSQAAAGSIAGTSGFFLNPITKIGMFGAPKVTVKRGFLSEDSFKGTVKSISYASCPDKVRNGDFDEVIGYVKDAFFK